MTHKQFRAWLGNKLASAARRPFYKTSKGKYREHVAGLIDDLTSILAEAERRFIEMEDDQALNRNV